MKLAGNYRFEAPRRIVWEALQDPDVLGQIMPGGQELEKIDENEYKAALKIRVGPVQGDFKGGIKLSEINPPNSYRMDVDGRGQPGFVKAFGFVKLEEDGDGTVMNYEGEAQVGGRIASVGQRLMDSSGKAMIKQSLDGLHEYVKARAAAEATVAEATETESGPIATDGADVVAKSTEIASAPTPKIEIKPPTQTQFAMGVAKNMLDDVISPSWQPVFFLVVGFVLGLIAGLLIGG